MLSSVEKFEMAIYKGFIYSPETGKVISPKGKEVVSKNRAGYLQFTYTHYSKTYSLYAHRFGFYFINKVDFGELDHINGIRDDNRICNLRRVTRNENNWNSHTTKGYYWHKVSNKWKAGISVNGKAIYLRLFEKEVDARQAYLQAKEKYHTINI